MAKRYLLTLNPHAEGLLKKVDLLSKEIGPVTRFSGVDGKMMPAPEYYRLLTRAYSVHGQLIAPSEIAATLSHVRILEDFLSSKEDLAIIFEDDVLIHGHSAGVLKEALRHVGPKDVLVACSQHGLEFLGEIRGRRITPQDECYEVSKLDWKTVKRSCAYAVGRLAAAHICEVQNRGTYPPDDFRVLCHPQGRLLLCNAFSHPKTKENSLLEPERQLRPATSVGRPLLSRIGREIKKTMLIRASTIHRRIHFAFRGYVSLKHPSESEM
jgi:GR25 family glycosyltransferase involved in LPS biosynthesis